MSINQANVVMQDITAVELQPEYTKPKKRNTAAANAISLQHEIHWFSKVMALRIQLYFVQGAELSDIYQLTPPDLSLDDSIFACAVKHYQLTFDERIVLILAIIPHVNPQALDSLFSLNANFDRCYAEFGGRQGTNHKGFLPTGETAAFILSGDDLHKRFELMAIFDDKHLFSQHNILTFEHHSQGEPFFSSSLDISNEFLNKFTTGITEKLDYSNRFPAKLITSQLSWQDLVLAPEVMDEIEKIKIWVKHSKTILQKWGLEKSLKPGYRSLFYGPPGTGKTLTATLLGVELERDVYRIDLSAMVSKFIGETEKNLAHLFDQAQNKNWILFFDEADALFGARSQGSSANDRHANQQVAYLLQRIEDFPGIVILATNLRANIDEAFSRRFQSLVYFPMPNSEQRQQLWLKVLNGNCDSDTLSAIGELAKKYELAGGAITNVVRYAAISAIQSNNELIHINDLKKGINKELKKEGKTI